MPLRSGKHTVEYVTEQSSGGGVLHKVKYGETPPQSPTPYTFIYHFGRKGTPFINLLLKKGTPFTYLVYLPVTPSYE